jgi:hypothetical protein
LPVEAGIVVRIHPAFKSQRGGGSVKETSGDAQCANLIASRPRSTYFVDLAIHVLIPVLQTHELTIPLAVDF